MRKAEEYHGEGLGSRSRKGIRGGSYRCEENPHFSRNERARNGAPVSSSFSGPQARGQSGVRQALSPPASLDKCRSQSARRDAIAILCHPQRLANLRRRPGYAAPAFAKLSAAADVMGCTFSARKRRRAAILPTLSNSASSLT